MDGGPLFVPDPIIVGTFDPGDVISSSQIGIVGVSARSGVDPIVVESQHHIGILVFFWGGVIQRHKLERNKVVLLTRSQRLIPPPDVPTHSTPARSS